MATISGVWVFDEKVTGYGGETLTLTAINFTSNGAEYSEMGCRTGNPYWHVSYRPAAPYGVVGYHRQKGWCINSADYETYTETPEIRTVDFGSTPQTVSDDFYTWLTSNAVQQSSDPSEPETDTLYTVNGFSLTTVANAIRGKAGTSGELIFPDGYVSAIEDISSVLDLSNAKDIAFGGNESGGKYVIEDETITPLFDQIRRITETEDAMTFEGATESLLNITPGGDLPSAEESAFGNDDASIKLGITSFAKSITVVDNANTAYAGGAEFKANQALAVSGVRVHSGADRTYTVYLYNASGELLKSVSDVNVAEDSYTDVYFDEPVNFGIEENFTVSVSKVYGHNIYKISDGVEFNGKITFQCGRSASNNDFPTKTNTTIIFGVVNPIISEVNTVELPDEYQIARTTMDAVANEVKRISGATGKMTTTQMLTALQSITLQDKTVTPTAEVQTVTPDDGYYALSSVTVEAIPATE